MPDGGYEFGCVLAPETHTCPEMGVTVDEVMDYFLIFNIVLHFHTEKREHYGYEEIVDFIRLNNLESLNGHVKRKIPGTDIFEGEKK